MKFRDIRLTAVEQWYTGLHRTRREGSYSDDYSDSLLCEWQKKCLDDDKHCSLLCSLGDWLDNISDQLLIKELDDLDETGDIEALFRLYTRIMLTVSEIVEDFVTVHKQITGIQGKTEAGNDLISGVLPTGELKRLSGYINSLTKHKTEHDNLHVHNHHQQKEFEDFGATPHDNQVSINNLAWKTMNKDTTILVPSLGYLVDLVIKLNQCFDNQLQTRAGYLDRLNQLYTDDYIWGSKEEVTEER